LKLKVVEANGGIGLASPHFNATPAQFTAGVR